MALPGWFDQWERVERLFVGSPLPARGQIKTPSSCVRSVQVVVVVIVVFVSLIVGSLSSTTQRRDELS